MKYLIMFILLVGYGCSGDIEEPGTQKQIADLSKYDREYKMSEVSLACVEGCMYNYNLYMTANTLVNKAVSLTSPQLDSIQLACTKFCGKKVLEKLDVEYQKIMKKKEVEQAKPSNESFESTETDREIKKEVEKAKKEPAKKDQEKAFEDL